jgi:hypothetical protein
MAARRNSMWVSGPLGHRRVQPHAHVVSPARSTAGEAALTEETIVELASILAAAYERYRRIVRVDEDAENIPEKELDTGVQPSPHGQ